MTNSKYRGIRKDGEGFVYGPLVNLFGKVWIADLARESDAKDMAETLGGIYTNMAGQLLTEVLPKTVGKFTGAEANDDGTEVYDGDAVDFNYFLYNGDDTSVKGEVVWLHQRQFDGGLLGAWALKLYSLNHFMNLTGERDLEESDMTPIPFCNLPANESSFTVTGNIHEDKSKA